MALFAILAVCGMQACGDDDKGINPDQAFVDALNSMNLNLQNVKWEKKGVYKVAEGKQALYDVDVWFDAEAKWAMTETDYGRDLVNVPQTIINSIGTIENGAYANWAIEDVEYYQRPDINFFKIEVESPGQNDVYLYYYEDGNFIKSTAIDEEITPITQFLTPAV